MSSICSYSVVIRTLGSTGAKYRALIDSIFTQTIQPEEIIVVLPEGYNLDYITGRERIVYSKKGMVSQRAVGISECKSEYMLVCDDDVAFGPTMVGNLYSYSIANGLDCCLPMEGQASDSEQTHINLGALSLKARLRGAFTGQVFVSKKKSPFLDIITKTAGHKIFVNSNRIDTCYQVQCGCFQCFFAKTSSAKAVHFEDETWLEEGTVTQYASYDDPTFYYKMYLQGGKAAYSLATRYTHLDATAGRPDKTLLDSKITRYYSVARNRTIFWYKFIYQEQKSLIAKTIAILCGIYGTVNYSLWNIAICLKPKYWPALSAMHKGYKDAAKYILSK